MSDIEMSMGKLARGINQRLRADWDLVAAVSGEEGVGKSTFSKVLAKKVYKKFSLDKHVLYSPTTKEMKKKIIDSERYAVIDADEAIKILYKLNWQSRGQRYLNTLYALIRDENKATFLNIPRFTDVNEFFRNHRVKLWVHVFARGHAVVFARDQSAFTKDPWHMKECEKLFAKTMAKEASHVHSGDVNALLLAFSKTPIFLGYVTFPDMPEDMKKAYKEEKAKHRYKDLEEESLTNRQREVMNQRNDLAFCLSRVMKNKSVAKILGMDTSNITRIKNNVKEERQGELKKFMNPFVERLKPQLPEKKPEKPKAPA